MRQVRRGTKNIAKEIALKTVKMVGSLYNGDTCIRSPRFNEWFNAINGQAYGNENLSWSCTVADLILRFLND
jgi:hypothetical protein